MEKGRKKAQKAQDLWKRNDKPEKTSSSGRFAGFCASGTPPSLDDNRAGVGQSCLNEGKEGVRISILAVPKARITEIVDLSDNRCKIRVKAPPVEGEANLALIEFLASVFGLTKKQVMLEHGSRGRQKVFLLSGISLGSAEKILSLALDPSASGKEKK